MLLKKAHCFYCKKEMIWVGGGEKVCILNQNCPRRGLLSLSMEEINKEDKYAQEDLKNKRYI